MAKLRNCTAALAMMLIVASSGWGTAQQPEAITVNGSGIANSLIERVAEAERYDCACHHNQRDGERN